MIVNQDTFVLPCPGFAPLPFHKPTNQVLLPLGKEEQAVQGLPVKNVERKKEKVVNEVGKWKE